MTNGTNKRYIKWVGLGFLYVWLCAFVAWMSLWNSGNTLAQVIAFVGISLVTVSCIALAFYMSALEEKVKTLSSSLAVAKQDAAHWESQAKLAFDRIESLNKELPPRAEK